MEEIGIQLPPDKKTVWDDIVPIIKSKKEKTYYAYISDAIGNPYIYNKLCYILTNKVKPDEKVVIRLTTPGGDLDSCTNIVNAIQRCKGHVVVELSGEVASAGTIITMYADDIVALDELRFMIHYYSGGVMGKGHEVKAQQKFYEEQVESWFKRIYKDFLTEEEINNVIEGKDIWMGKDEVLERWKKKVEAKNI